MRLEDVLPALREGRIIRRPATHPDEIGTFERFVLGSDGTERHLLIISGQTQSKVDLGTGDILADDWEIEK